MKTHVLIVSRTFPKTHKRAGEETYFPDKILYQQKLKEGYETPCLICSHHYETSGKCKKCFDPFKIHTIRSNYELWDKRIKEVQEGKAILSLRYWLGKPYDSKQVEFCRLDKDSDVGIQLLQFSASGLIGMIRIDEKYGQYHLDLLSKNDSLSLEDFKDWFKGYDLSKPMAIIHFTKFRY